MSEEFEHVEVNGRALRYVCGGEGAPTVVVDQGQGASIERNFEAPVALGWSRVFGEVRKSTSVVMHDRAGLGSSDRAPRPRACREMVKDLRAVLRDAEAAPPYVLVGHSLGGFNVRAFAAQYPDEVAGMVLVDSCHPEQRARIAEILPPESRTETPPLRLLRHGLDPGATPEGIDFRRCAEQARALESLGHKPLIVVSQSPRAFCPPGIPAEVWESMRLVWSALQGDLLGLSANARHVLAEHAGHHVQIDEPQLVITAILDVVRETRTTSARLH